MEDSLILEVSNIKISLAVRKVLPDHLLIITCDSIVERQVAVVIFCVKFWSYFFHDTSLTSNAHDMFDRMAFVVLLASSSVKVVGASEPIEYLDITFSSADEEHILTKIVLNHYSFGLPSLECS